MLRNHDLNQDAPEESIAALVDAVKSCPDRRDILVELLPERIALYGGRGTNATIRIRGYILAAFEQTGLPDAALPFVLEELENGRDAYLVAAAAKALRGLHRPTSRFIPLLFKAIENIKFVDDAVTFDSYKPQWPVANYSTALAEIFKTFAWLGDDARTALLRLEALYADRDAFSATITTEIRRAIDGILAAQNDTNATDSAAQMRIASVAAHPIELVMPEGRAHDEHRPRPIPVDVELEDQNGRTIRYGNYFSQHPSIVVFFYTRCNNPNKCSLTITKLARLQHAITEKGLQGQLNTAAITYDPEYDLPARLKAYGESRGLVFGDHERVFRTRTGFKELQDYFGLGVNFSNSIVNHHRIELFILDDRGGLVDTFARLQWDIQAVLDHASVLLR